jgi:hypothetical protein
MPEDTGLVKSYNNNKKQSSAGMTMSLDEFDQLIRERIHKVLIHFDPPPELWERIKVQAQGSRPVGNSC